MNVLTRVTVEDPRTASLNALHGQDTDLWQSAEDGRPLNVCGGLHVYYKSTSLDSVICDRRRETDILRCLDW